MIERQVEVVTKAGRMGVFVCHPERDGPHPVVLFLMDAPGIREELRDMARRLASVGYYVLLPNLYYRSRAEELGPFVGKAGAPVRELMGGLMATLTIAKVMDDVDALIAFANEDDAASKGPIGCFGYCMSGQYALSAAARHPGLIAAAASIYGTHLVTDWPDSPHLTVPRAKADLYIAYAEDDHYAPLDTAAPLGEALRAGGARFEIEVYPGVQHGFAFPGRPMYDRPAAERHWERLFALFDRNLAQTA